MRKSNPAKTSKRGAHWVGPNKLAGTWWCELTDSSSLFRDVPWLSYSNTVYSNLHLQMMFQYFLIKTASMSPCLMHFNGVPMAVQSLWGCFSVHGMAWPGPWDTQKIPIFLDKPTYQTSSWIHTHIYIYNYIYIIISMCVCVSHWIPLKMKYPSKKMEKRHADFAFKRRIGRIPQPCPWPMRLWEMMDARPLLATCARMRLGTADMGWMFTGLLKYVEVYRNHTLW